MRQTLMDASGRPTGSTGLGVPGDPTEDWWSVNPQTEREMQVFNKQRENAVAEVQNEVPQNEKDE
jgi:hypothetical protein